MGQAINWKFIVPSVASILIILGLVTEGGGETNMRLSGRVVVMVSL